MMKVDVAILGGGPAGLAAALAAKEQGAKDVMILERDTHLGGILQQCIHNGFGLHYFGEELTGPEYAQRFIDKVLDTDITIKLDTMVLDLTQDKVIKAVNSEDGYFEVEAKAVVLAMGCRERTRGALSLAGSRPAGIYTAGSAQYMVNMQAYMPGKEVVILGSGDIGLIMARRMTWEGANVKMVYELMPYSSGLARNVSQCLDDYGIPLLLSHTLVEIHGKDRLEAVTIAQVDENRKPIKKTYQRVSCDTLLLSVGLIPENELTQEAEIKMDRRTRGAIVDERRQTSVSGIFACGNVLHVHDLVDNVSHEAEIAGRAAAVYASRAQSYSEFVEIVPGDQVGYCVPQNISKDAEGEVDVYFRVRSIIKPATVEVMVDGKVQKIRKRPIVTPGEMEKITLKKELIDKANATISIAVK